MIQVSRVLFPVTALGPGRRFGVWFQGCSIGCRGCIARDTWPIDGGRNTSIESITTTWQRVLGGGADGITISGGEPADQPADLIGLLSSLRETFTEARLSSGLTSDILLYTGYDLDEFKMRAPGALDLIDAVITGPYDAAKPTNLIWRGSANQELKCLTPLGEERYGSFIEHVPERPPMQVDVTESSIQFIGVPGRGDLQRIERSVRAKGLRLEDTSWRP